MLSVIFVNYRSAWLLRDALETFRRYNQDLKHEIIVVDNHSCDGSKDIICTEFTEVRWIDSGYNAG